MQEANHRLQRDHNMEAEKSRHLQELASNSEAQLQQTQSEVALLQGRVKELENDLLKCQRQLNEKSILIEQLCQQKNTLEFENRLIRDEGNVSLQTYQSLAIQLESVKRQLAFQNQQFFMLQTNHTLDLRSFQQTAR